MPVSNRIKILKCCSFEEVEEKVNDFLAFNEYIEQLVTIDYRLEFNVVIIEYYVMNSNNSNNDRDNRDSKKVMGWGDYSYGYTPFRYWLFFPFN